MLVTTLAIWENNSPHKCASRIGGVSNFLVPDDKKTDRGVILMIPQKPIETSNGIISISGKVIYNDRRRRLTVKKPVRDLFEKGQNEVGYIMEICLNEEKTIERIKELRKKNITPVMLYFTEEKREYS
jgi:hypothetical protein